VFVHTDTLPEWVPIAGEGRVVNTWSDGMKAVVRTLETLESATTAEIVETVDLSRQQVFEHLETLRERGVLDRKQDETDGRRFIWVDDGLHRIGEHGEAELEPVDLGDLDESEVRQVARSSTYTWNFTNSTAEDVLDLAQTDTSGEPPAPKAAEGPGPPG
jgi:DNA-binding transcriptional ArsR family regulator